MDLLDVQRVERFAKDHIDPKFFQVPGGCRLDDQACIRPPSGSGNRNDLLATLYMTSISRD